MASDLMIASSQIVQKEKAYLESINRKCPNLDGGGPGECDKEVLRIMEDLKI